MADIVTRQTDKGTCYCGGVAKQELTLLSREKGTRLYLCYNCFAKAQDTWKDFINVISKT